ncbi:ROK family protein [Polymorphospora sp. NPDC050346]|uniref:ROK family protein n=1 Tax=Polymorphospora sp. NPDC050346 TaxID=3155780 RepID=UPI0033D10C9B
MAQAGTRSGNTPVRQASLREHNLGLVLRHIATGPPTAGSTEAADGTVGTGGPAAAGGRAPSRADIAASTGLTRATVSALVDDLIGGRLVTEVAPAPRAGAGRPALGLVLAGNGPAGLGLEINVDYLAACVVDLTGRVRHRVVHRADQRPAGPRDVLARIADLAAAVRGEAERQGLAHAGTALAVPGLVTADGVVRLAPNLGWRDVDVPALVHGHPALAGAPLTVDNEANLAALGELHTAGPASFLYVSGEIGIGAGIVLDGALLRGARGWSGELGHVAVRPDGPPCGCGARGCLERYAGQDAILAAAGLAGRGHTADQAVARLTSLAEAADPAALRALADAGSALGVTVAGVINVLDVDTVVLGGVYAPLTPWLGPAVEDEVNHRVLTAGWSPVTVRASRLGGDAAVVGAAGSVVRAVLDRPARWLTGGRP